ncbi:MAG TPA: LCP family protein [Anaerolineales bacterium]|nr:LCP family protein [Anaerolineales bacterium]
MKTRVLLVLPLILFAATVACNLPIGGLVFNPTPAFDPTDPVITLPPEVTDTPQVATVTAGTPPPSETPTLTPTPSPTLTPTPAWGSFPGPSQDSAIEIQPPMPPLAFADRVLNFVVLGSDQRPSTGGYRTDVLMIVSLDPEAGKATLLSIPRDLYVYIPGWKVERINTADVHGGPQTTALTMLYNFGIPIHHWVRVNFSGFQTAVDMLGGIDVQVTGYLNDECGGIHHQYSPGLYHMDGFTALCYVRMRKASSDFDRLRREQEVAQAIFSKVLTLDGLSRVPQLYEQFSSLVQTDARLDDLLPVVPLAASLATGSAKIEHFSVDSTMVTSWRTPAGAAVLLPKRDAILAMLQTAFGP